MAITSEGVFYPGGEGDFNDWMTDWKETADTTSAQFTDLRTVRYGEYTSSVATQDAQQWGVGTVSTDATRTINSPVTPNAENLVFPPGVYSLGWIAAFGIAVTGRTYVSVSNGAEVVARANAAVGEDRVSVAIPCVRFTAQTTLTLAVFQTSGGVRTVSHRFRVMQLD